MTNWEFFKKENKYALRILRNPQIIIVNQRKDDSFLFDAKEAVAYYSCDDNTIHILKQYNCVALRFHEYGHWVIEIIYTLLTVFWEFLWWGCSIRKFFLKGKGGE